MSVYYQALRDGRITKGECRSRPHRWHAGVTVDSVTAKALKRGDAEYRNSLTEPHRRKAYRRALAAELASAASKRKAGKA